MPNEKHLEFLQSAIARMASNSFQMKAWSVAIATAAIGFAAAKDQLPGAAAFGVIPIATFWGLDAYYLALEQGFRNLYDSARVAPGTSSTFEMTPTGAMRSWPQCALRPAILFVHLPMALVVIAVATLK
jgi:hypothetical protein